MAARLERNGHLMQCICCMNLKSHKTMTHLEVIKRFANKQINRNTKTCSWESGSIFCDENQLYSYGTHFTLALRLPQGNAAVFLLNGEFATPSTSQHQNLLRRHLDGPTVSFSALLAAGIDVDDFLRGRAKVKDFVTDRTFYAREHKQTKRFQRAKNYEAGCLPHVEFVDMKKQGSGTFSQWLTGDMDDGWNYFHWHLGGAGVLITYENEYFLGVLDEQQYCFIQLRRPAATVASALQQLKPAAVKKAEAAGIRVQRQGEWFFVHQDVLSNEFSETIAHGDLCKHLRSQGFDCKVSDIRKRDLPILPKQKNYHEVSRMLKVGKGSKQQLWCSGKVFHRDARTGHLTNEHATLNLRNDWWLAYRNCEAQSWTTTGKFD